VFIEAKDDGGDGDNWTTGAISRAKLQSNHHYQQTNIQFFTGRMPFLSPNQQCQSTEGLTDTWCMLIWCCCFKGTHYCLCADPEEHPQTELYWGHVNPIGPRACYDEAKRVAETMCYAYQKQVIDLQCPCWILEKPVTYLLDPWYFGWKIAVPDFSSNVMGTGIYGNATKM